MPTLLGKRKMGDIFFHFRKGPLVTCFVQLYLNFESTVLNFVLEISQGLCRCVKEGKSNEGLAYISVSCGQRLDNFFFNTWDSIWLAKLD